MTTTTTTDTGDRYVKITSFPDIVIPEPNVVEVELAGVTELFLSFRRSYLKNMDKEWLSPDEVRELSELDDFKFAEFFSKDSYIHFLHTYRNCDSVFYYIRRHMGGDTRRKYDFRAEGVMRSWTGGSPVYEDNSYAKHEPIRTTRNNTVKTLGITFVAYQAMFYGAPSIITSTYLELKAHRYNQPKRAVVRDQDGRLHKVEACTATVYPDYFVYDTPYMIYTRDGYALPEHTVPVTNRSGLTTDWYMGNLPSPVYHDTLTDKYFDYDPSEYPFQIWNGEHVSKDYNKDRYSVVRGMPNILYDHTIGEQDYNDDVLDYLPGFRTLEGEDSVRGNRVHRKNTLFMGVELEVDMSRSATMSTHEAITEVMKAMQGQAICVHDGSLSDEGFEIVSVPATLGFHYGMWEELCTGPLRRQLVSYIRPECGLHIHLTKEAFSDYTLGMFNTFINSSHNNKFISDISGRKPNSYCARRETKVTCGKRRDKFVDARGEELGKYHATNLRKPHTLEVRMFKGTLAYGSLMKSLEFCHALHKFVSYFAAHHMLKYEDFITWFTDKKNGNRKTYPYLWTFLCSREYITDTSKAMLVFTKGQVSESLVDGGTYKPLSLEESAKAFGKDHTSRVEPHVLELFRKLNTHKVTKLNA